MPAKDKGRKQQRKISTKLRAKRQARRSHFENSCSKKFGAEPISCDTSRKRNQLIGGPMTRRRAMRPSGVKRRPVRSEYTKPRGFRRRAGLPMLIDAADRVEPGAIRTPDLLVRSQEVAEVSDLSMRNCSAGFPIIAIVNG